MGGVSFDSSEVTALVKSFADATGGPAMRDVAAVVAKGALNIKRDSSRRISGHPHFRALPAAITYEAFVSLRGPAAEIGPDHARRQGNLGHIPENGTLTSPPTPYMAPAGDAEEPRIAKALEALAVKAIEP